MSDPVGGREAQIGAALAVMRSPSYATATDEQRAQWIVNHLDALRSSGSAAQTCPDHPDVGDVNCRACLIESHDAWMYRAKRAEAENEAWRRGECTCRDDHASWCPIYRLEQALDWMEHASSMPEAEVLAQRLRVPGSAAQNQEECDERIEMLIRERDHAWDIVESFQQRSSSKDDPERLREVLRKISTQGIGRWDNERKCMIDQNGEPWRHWAKRAEEALAVRSPQDEDHEAKEEQ